MSGARTLVATVLLAASVGVGLALWLHHVAPIEPGGAEIGDRRPDFEHAGLDGRYWSADDLDGRPALVNFWATWCAPCVREMPLLDAFDREQGAALKVVGIAVDDPSRVPQFVERLGVGYPILLGGDDVRTTQQRFGNAAGLLPYTVLLDADGIIRWQHLGELERADLDRAMGRLR